MMSRFPTTIRAVRLRMEPVRFCGGSLLRMLFFCRISWYSQADASSRPQQSNWHAAAAAVRKVGPASPKPCHMCQCIRGTSCLLDQLHDMHDLPNHPRPRTELGILMSAALEHSSRRLPGSTKNSTRKDTHHRIHHKAYEELQVSKPLQQ